MLNRFTAILPYHSKSGLKTPEAPVTSISPSLGLSLFFIVSTHKEEWISGISG